MSSRRDFLKYSSLASAATLMPGFLSNLAGKALNPNGKKLVIIQFSGGNDGLNTCIPYRDDGYFQARPSLAIPSTEVLPLTDELALNPTMTGLRSLYDEGLVTILNRVGYPNPDRSHFRSMDIWHSASNADEYWNTGWLGRYLDADCVGCAKPHKILEIDDLLSLAVKGTESKALALQDVKRLLRSTQDRYVKSLSEAYEAASQDESNLDYLYKTMAETVNSAEYLHQQSRIYRSTIDYPQGKLGKQLKLVAELLISGVDTSVFYVSLSGFDTHVRQRGQQDRLLKQYSEAVSAFVKDLKQNNQLNDTLIMTFSEFGRRVAQNASGGTDHGKANNLFLIGGGLKQAGVYNAAPDLTQLDAGDVPFDIDFRQVYATVLKDWLDADDEAILARKFKRLKLV